MTERQESEERLARPLIHLARMAGIATSYVGMSDDYHEIDDDVLVAVLAALGLDASDDDAIVRSTKALLDARRGRLVAPTVLHVAGRESRVLVNVGVLEVPSATITLESGEDYGGAIVPGPGDGAQAYPVDGRFMTTASLTIPADLPLGYHTLAVTVGERTEYARLISVPERVELLDPMKGGRLWGWMAQLYSIRSADSWGVGDYEDLKSLLTDAAHATGADFMLVNPLHAGEPVSPLTPSPYLPVSRRFVNFTYIRPEAIPEYATMADDARRQVDELRGEAEPLDGDAQVIDRDAMWRLKMHALWIIFKAGRDGARQAVFEEYKRHAGDGLEAYATWCLCYDKWGAPSADLGNWERRLSKESPEVIGLRDQFPDTLEFYRWLEWTASEQLAGAQRAAKDAGMRIGVMADMAVGVHPLGADVWWNPERFAKGATVGAPPDMFNQQGQDWSQPPLNPIDLAATGYEAYRTMVRDMFAYAGAVRIDHILGLFRLWWIPEGRKPLDGAYVHYDADVMLGILALEAQRAGGVVVGEDLGVVPAYVADSLSAHGILGCAVEWFEQRDGAFRAPGDYRPYALASVNTHDLPPAAGYLEFEHVKLRERLGLLEGSAEDFERSARHERDAMLRMLVDNGYLDASLADDPVANERAVVEAQYRALTGTPCKLLAAAIVDAVGEKRAQNQPGTNNEYPNWRIPLADAEGNPVPVEGLFEREGAQRLAAIMNGTA
ncbi:4-alpha-glucanotransferase [Bifidobacterium pullorum subsp. saeculare]|uniref:4-alpha-glucanotransferase n=1 Tax=Bifidobacterium pullorum subsp. saeculare TaxID=78257 RepID=A0A939BAQ0_9BIFI|nr:4-alpha-glucanotransferase [Bifidobacterium pullorum]MBM6700116.1 4-alpha-glucanotransferase [Bifidobacterium pullorum subsp. saeculare]